MSNFILTLKLDTEKYQEDILNKRLEISRKIYNACLGELHKRYNHMRESKEYRKVCKLTKSKERNKQFQELNKKYSLTEYSLHDFVKPMQKHFKSNIDSFTVQKIATRCFNAFQKLMFHQAKKVYFKKFDEMNSVEGKSNSTGIRFKDNKLLWNGLVISVIIKKNDYYAKEALDNKIKYCRIVRKIIKEKYYYYVQLILEGIPPTKIDKETGEIKHRTTIGKVGIDIGTQTVAISSNTEVKLLELAHSVNKIDKELKRLQRKLDRQRRKNNKDNYNENGTIKKGLKLTWNKSKRYIKTQIQIKELFRKQTEIRKLDHNIMINWLITLGDKFYVETMNYKGLQSKVKETKKDDKGKFKSKKRFGKSLANKSPAMFLTLLDNKLKFQDNQLNKIDTWKVKASQYNHIEDEYIKKNLSNRWNDFSEFKIQRDLYSAFLIMCVKDNLKEIDRELCFKEFDNFKMLHDKEIERIKSSNNKIISSMGI